MKNFTDGIASICRARSERIVEAGSLSSHSSRASMTMVVDKFVDFSGRIRRSSSWIANDSSAASGLELRISVMAP